MTFGPNTCCAEQTHCPQEISSCFYVQYTSRNEHTPAERYGDKFFVKKSKSRVRFQEKHHSPSLRDRQTINWGYPNPESPKEEISTRRNMDEPFVSHVNVWWIKHDKARPSRAAGGFPHGSSDMCLSTPPNSLSNTSD